MKKFNLKNEIIERNAPEKPGIYHIYCFNRNHPIKIGRLLKADEKGILSIGSTKNLKRRLKQFVYGSIKHSGHSSGNRYGYLNLANKRKLGSYELKFSFEIKKKCEFRESELLRGYMEKFGELPPLNNREPLYDHLKILGYAE